MVSTDEFWILIGSIGREKPRVIIHLYPWLPYKANKILDLRIKIGSSFSSFYLLWNIISIFTSYFPPIIIFEYVNYLKSSQQTYIPCARWRWCVSFCNMCLHTTRWTQQLHIIFELVQWFFLRKDYIIFVIFRVELIRLSNQNDKLKGKLHKR